MPSDRAKDNKTLVAACVACSKVLSTEVMVSLTGYENRQRKEFPVCINCAQGGWRPPGFTGLYTFRPQ